jgi:hypothetical protein
MDDCIAVKLSSFKASEYEVGDVYEKEFILNKKNKDRNFIVPPTKKLLLRVT